MEDQDHRECDQPVGECGCRVDLTAMGSPVQDRSHPVAARLSVAGGQVRGQLRVRPLFRGEHLSHGGKIEHLPDDEAQQGDHVTAQISGVGRFVRHGRRFAAQGGQDEFPFRGPTAVEDCPAGAGAGGDRFIRQPFEADGVQLVPGRVEERRFQFCPSAALAYRFFRHIVYLSSTEKIHRDSYWRRRHAR